MSQIEKRHPVSVSQKTIHISGPKEVNRLHEALEKAVPGTRITLAPGVYRDSFIVSCSGTAENPIIIEAEVPGKTIITGADPITTWEKVPSLNGVWSTPIDLSAIPPSKKHGILSGRCEQVFVDGLSLRQVLHADQLVGGTFCYEEANHRLLICPQIFPGELRGGKAEIDGGSITGGGTVAIDRTSPENCWQFLIHDFDPAKHTIEVTRRRSLLSFPGDHKDPTVSHVTIRGLTFRASGDQPQQAMVRFVGNHLTIEDCLFEHGAARGFDLRTNYSVVRGCCTRLNGQMGFSGYGVDNLMEDSALLYNNTKHSEFVCFEQGGSKICRTDRFIMRRIRCVGNDGPGIWYDIDNTNALIEQCWCEGNSGPGIMYEISSDADIRNNVMLRNGYAYRKDERFNSINNSVGHIEPVYGQGILVQMSRRVRVYNNTCVGNRRCGIELRHHAYQQAGFPGHATETYRLEDIDVFNNALVDNNWDNLMISTEPGNPLKASEVRNNSSDFNLFHSTDALLQHGGNLLAYCRWGKTLVSGSCSLEEWRASRNMDLNSIQWDPYFMSPGEGDFSPEPFSPLLGRGRPVEGLTTDYAGNPRPAENPAIGAFERSA